jgi:3-dehydrotetronate 4-kinase
MTEAASSEGGAVGRQRPWVGCIADDYTGGTDVAIAFRRVGLRTILLFGEPPADAPLGDCDAVVVALKSRNMPPDEAVSATLAVQRWFVTCDVEHTYFKYCSTFDSTDEGNIGIVADALLDAVGGDLTVICPAAPEHGRTVYQGHLFVGTQLLSESPMRHHPLTPMTDSNLVRVLSRQTTHPVKLVPHHIVREGAAAVGAAFTQLASEGTRFAVTDALTDDDLAVVAQASRALPVLTGAAGLARMLGSLAPQDDSRLKGHAVPLPPGPTLVLAGSCSATTLEQVRRAQRVLPSLQLAIGADPVPSELAAQATSWLDAHADAPALMIFSSAPHHDRPSDDDQAPSPGPAIETAMAAIARHAVDAGVRRLIVAGGETSGSVVGGLSIDRAVVAFEEDMGVPWIIAEDRGLALLLKSGNFGKKDLFVRAAGRE